jgi:predicted metal-binding membrane protein
VLNYLENKNQWIGGILGVATKYQYNTLKSICFIRHSYDPTPKQTEDVDGQN